MQNIKPISQEIFELLRHIKSVDRRTDRQTDGWTDRKGDYYRAPAFTRLKTLPLHNGLCSDF